MINYIKGETLKYQRSKFKYISIILLFMYIIIVFCIYKYNNIEKIELYKNFYDEMYYIYLLLIILFTSNILNKDINLTVTKYVDKNKLFISKIIICLLYLIYILFLSILLNILISVFFYKTISIKNIFIIINTLQYNILFYVLIININILLSIIIKRESIVLIIDFIYLFSLNYIHNFIINKSLKTFYYLPSLITKYNNYILITNKINPLYGLLIYFIIIFIIYIVSKRLLRRL